MKILILGSVHSRTSTAYQRLGLPVSELVTSATQEFTVGHTAAGDISTEDELEKLMSACDKVYWAFPAESEFESITEFAEHLAWLKEYQFKHNNVVNFWDIEFDTYNWKEDLPKISKDDAVFVGCSFTQGAWLDDPDTNSYTQLVAKQLGLNCVNLGKNGSNNFRTFDILNQVELSPGQTVVIQLTVPERVRYVDNKLVTYDYVTSQLPKQHAVISSHYDSIRHTNRLLTQFLRYSRREGLKVVFWLIDYKNEPYTTQDQMYYYNMPEFVPPTLIHNYMIDAARDGIHPGIESQKVIADAILTHYRRIYEC